MSVSFNQFIAEVEHLYASGARFSDIAAMIEVKRVSLLDYCEANAVPLQYSKALIVKVANLLMAKIEYLLNHEKLLASPLGLFIDPSNGCPLHCPGCLHNKEFQENVLCDWGGGLLNEAIFSRFLAMYGSYATVLQMFNWGEPLLNKRTPDFIKRAKSYLLYVSLSSNLSVQFDAEALVLSGLDFLIMSIDGVSQGTYEKYRKGGNLETVFENVKKLVAAKKKFNRATPVLYWQFLLFEHNKHEVETAKVMAKELGVDIINFATPYDVSWDDEIKIAKDVESCQVNLIQDPARMKKAIFETINDVTEEFDAVFSKKFDVATSLQPDPVRNGSLAPPCKWLYSTIVMDATGRILPCCYVPRRQDEFSYIFSDVHCLKDMELDESPFNSKLYKQSRKFFSLRDKKREHVRQKDTLHEVPPPYCVTCPDSMKTPLIGEEQLKNYFFYFDQFELLDEKSRHFLCNWDN